MGEHKRNKYVFKYAIVKIKSELLQEEDELVISGTMPVGEEEKNNLITLLRQVQSAKADRASRQVHSEPPHQ